MSAGSYRDWLESQMPSMAELIDTKRKGPLRIYRYPQTALAWGAAYRAEWGNLHDAAREPGCSQ